MTLLNAANLSESVWGIADLRRHPFTYLRSIRLDALFSFLFLSTLPHLLSPLSSALGNLPNQPFCSTCTVCAHKHIRQPTGTCRPSPSKTHIKLLNIVHQSVLEVLRPLCRHAVVLSPTEKRAPRELYNHTGDMFIQKDAQTQIHNQSTCQAQFRKLMLPSNLPEIARDQGNAFFYPWREFCIQSIMCAQGIWGSYKCMTGLGKTTPQEVLEL